jgi:hypothetical protein
VVEEIAVRSRVGERRCERESGTQAALDANLQRVVVRLAVGCDLLEVRCTEAVLRVRKDDDVAWIDDALIEIAQLAPVSRPVTDVLDVGNHFRPDLILGPSAELLHHRRELVRILNPPHDRSLVDVRRRDRCEAVAEHDHRRIVA